MKTKHIIIGLIILVGILFFTQNKEHAGSTPATPATPLLSNEAIQNIAKVYADTNNTATFNNLNVTGTSNLTPRGTVTAWYGDITKIPSTWALCDGTNGTPDLRGRFVLGAGKGDGLIQRDMNAKGGEENVTLNESEMPAHTHYLFVNADGGRGNVNTLYPNVAGINTYVYGVSNSNDNTERYRLNAGSTTPANAGVSGWKGGSQAHNNMPPFYVLAYIMKL
jgi:microcystin-dependent protein